MPKVFSWNGYRFHFYSDEGHPREPKRINVGRGEADCKFWQYPEIRLAYNHGFDARELKQLTEVVEAHRTEIERDYGGITVTAYLTPKHHTSVSLLDGDTQ